MFRRKIRCIKQELTCSNLLASLEKRKRKDEEEEEEESEDPLQHVCENLIHTHYTHFIYCAARDHEKVEL